MFRKDYMRELLNGLYDHQGESEVLDKTYEWLLGEWCLEYPEELPQEDYEVDDDDKLVCLNITKEHFNSSDDYKAYFGYEPFDINKYEIVDPVEGEVIY